jgi:putative transposase
MRKSRFTESQIVAVLKEGEAAVAPSELTRKHGISRATYFNWQATYGGVSVSELKRMKGLEVENAKNSGADIKLARRFSASPTRCRRLCVAISFNAESSGVIEGWY